MIEHRWLSLFLALSTPFLALADDSSPLSPRIRGMGGVDMLQIRDSYFLEQCSSGCVAVFCQCVAFSVQCNCTHKDETGPPDCAIDISQGDSCNTDPSNVVQACKINCDALNPDGTVRSITDSDSSTQTAFTESAVSPDPTNPADNGRGGPAGSSSATTTSADVGNEGGPAATSSETAGAAAATSHPTATSTPIVSSSSHRGGLSTGAKAGIAVGVIVGVALIAFVAFCLFRNRKKGQSPVMAEEAKTLDSDQNGPSIVHPDPYSDSPATGTGYSPDRGRFSWMQAQSPTGPLASGGVAVAAAAAAPAATSPTAQNAHASRDMSEQDGAAYWQRSSAHMSNPPQESLAGVPAAAAAPRSSLQHERSPSAASSPTYTAYSPPVQQPATSAAAAPAAAQDAPPEHEWDDDERRLEAEMAEIDRMRQLRDERAALG